MDEKDWLLLRALRDTRNITKAADVLNTSQPGLSKRLRLIEERFGTSIALRNKSGIEFTPAGEYLVEYAAEMLDRLRAAHEHINDMGTEIKGTLRIGASNYCISFILPDILSAFKKEHPQVEFLVTSAWSSDVVKIVGSGEVHVGFIRNDSALPPERILLCTERTYICSTRTIDLESLPDEPQIAYKSDPLVAAGLNMWWVENYKRPPKIAMVVDRVGSSVEMVRNGLGWAFLSEKMANQMEGIQKYEIKHPDGQPYARHTWAVPNQDAKHLGMVASFLDFIAKRVFK
ncbi:LysR substrate-binding protein [uncultured delta proteobacterium]|uniref:LysR substrate-binding protein n=1 Tax=uncultured delta proteobacterium TaxID=34034 RepID=A0A212KB32_9DELT|nr:LysR substrate-binding protein [uncultured delta proteobacterium]